MRILSVLTLLASLISCKNNQSNSTVSNSSYQIAAFDSYEPNPDEAVFQLKLIESELTGKTWKNTMTVVRQFKSGFGFKDRLAPGTTIILLSNEKLIQDEFYCAAEFKLSDDSNSSKTFVLRTFLKK